MSIKNGTVRDSIMVEIQMNELTQSKVHLLIVIWSGDSLIQYDLIE